MDQKEQKTRERILLTAISIINEEGVKGVTTRNISEKAKVNMAAVNYYFGTKENLIKLALEATLNQAFTEEEARTLFSEGNLGAALKEYLQFAFQGTLNFPGIVKAHLFLQEAEIDYDTSFFNIFNSFVSQFYESFKSKNPSAKKSEVFFAILALLSALIVPGLLPQIVKPSSGLDFADPKVQKKYLGFLQKFTQNVIL